MLHGADPASRGPEDRRRQAFSRPLEPRTATGIPRERFEAEATAEEPPAGQAVDFDGRERLRRLAQRAGAIDRDGHPRPRPPAPPARVLVPWAEMRMSSRSTRTWTSVAGAGERLARHRADQALVVAGAAVGRCQRADLDVLGPHEEEHLLTDGEAPRGRRGHRDPGHLRPGPGPVTVAGSSFMLPTNRATNALAGLR